MPEISITREDDGRHGRYVGRIAGLAGEAEITFTHRGNNTISADHTGAPDSMRGTGAAKALVEYLVADARTNGFKVIPVCPFVRAQYAKNPQWQDVFTEKPGEDATRTGG